MKTKTERNTYGHKTAIRLLTMVFVSALAVSGCRKEKKEDEQVITTDDAADVVEYSLSSSSGGFAEQVSDGSEYAYEQGLRAGTSLECGVAFDTTVTRSHTGTITASYTHQRHFLLGCDSASNPVSLEYSGSYSGNYDGPRMHSSNTGNRNWIVKGLEAGSADYIYNGSFTRSGEHVSEVRNQYTFTSSLSMNTSNLHVAKSDRRIVSGTSSLTLSCMVSNGNTYSFSGSIVFNADHTATLTLNGNTYTIVLY